MEFDFKYIIPFLLLFVLYIDISKSNLVFNIKHK